MDPVIQQLRDRLGQDSAPPEVKEAFSDPVLRAALDAAEVATSKASRAAAILPIITILMNTLKKILGR